MNTLIIAGNVGKDAVTRNTQGGDKVTGFSVAVSNGRDKEATWFDCSFWGDRGEKVAQYITKGSKITVSGRVSARVHEGKAYLQVAVFDVTLQGASDGGGRQSDSRQDRSDEKSKSSDMDDEIPF